MDEHNPMDINCDISTGHDWVILNYNRINVSSLDDNQEAKVKDDSCPTRFDITMHVIIQ